MSKKKVIEIDLLELDRTFRIEGICAIRSTRVNLLEKLKGGEYVHLQVNKKGHFPSYKEQVYSFRDDRIDYLSLSEYNECKRNIDIILILICLLIVGVNTVSIRNDLNSKPDQKQ